MTSITCAVTDGGLEQRVRADSDGHYRLSTLAGLSVQ
jgi:hypothetical protein